MGGCEWACVGVDLGLDLSLPLVLDAGACRKRIAIKAAIIVSLSVTALGVFKKSAAGGIPALCQRTAIHKWALLIWSPPLCVTFGQPAQSGQTRHVATKKNRFD